MKKLIYLFVLLTFISTNINAQSKGAQKLSDNLNLYSPSLINFYNSVATNQSMEDPDATNIEGSPYLDDTFAKGYLITTDSILYSDVYLRYNNYKDVMEFRKDDKAYEISSQFPILTISFNEKIFERKLFQSNEQVKLGYFELLSEGRTKLYIKRDIILKEAKPAAGYQSAKQPVFKEISPLFFLQKNNEKILHAFKNKKELSELLSDKKDEIKNFIKLNKTNLDNERDLSKLINYYNSIKSN